MKSKRILIVGAGITGCTLAALLEKQGIVPTIVEKTKANAANGFGISIMPRGLKVLESLGIRGEMENVGNVLSGCRLYDERANELTSIGLSTVGVDSITLDRDDLLSILRRRLKKTDILWQTSVLEMRQTAEEVQVTFTDGKQGVYDLVVGADGMNSRVRSMIMPGTQPEKVGAAVWMLTLPTGCSLSDRKFAQLVFGNYRFMAIFPYRNTAAVAFTMPLDKNIDPHSVDIKKAFVGMSPIGDNILESLDIERLYMGHLRQLKLKDWSSGRILLAGDAAHAMVPASGMGASNGIQDAGILAQLIADMPYELLDMLPRRYQKIQKPIIDAKQREAYMLGHLMLMNRYQAIVRNKLFEVIPKSLLGRAVVRS